MGEYVLFYRWPDYAFHMTGRFADELALLAAARQRFPHDFDLCLVELGAHAALGHRAEVERRIKSCAPLSDGEVLLSEEQLMLLAGREFRAHGHHADADRIFSDLVQRAEASFAAGMYEAAGMGSTYYEAGRWTKALPYLREVLDTAPGARPLRAAMLAIAAVHAGDRATARACNAWLARQDDGKKVPVIMWRARVAAHEGRLREANAHIRRARGLHAQVMATWHDDPGLTPLRGRPTAQPLADARLVARAPATTAREAEHRYRTRPSAPSLHALPGPRCGTCRVREKRTESSPCSGRLDQCRGSSRSCRSA